MPGQPVIVPAPTTYAELIERVKNPCDYMCVNWYLCFKNSMNSNMDHMNNMSCNSNMRLPNEHNIKLEPQEVSKAKKVY